MGNMIRPGGTVPGWVSEGVTRLVGARDLMRFIFHQENHVMQHNVSTIFSYFDHDNILICFMGVCQL